MSALRRTGRRALLALLAGGAAGLAYDATQGTAAIAGQAEPPGGWLIAQTESERAVLLAFRSLQPRQRRALFAFMQAWADGMLTEESNVLLLRPFHLDESEARAVLGRYRAARRT